MTAVAVAVCPATPLVSPEVSVTPDGVADMQAACRAAVAALLEVQPDRVVVIGEAPRLAAYDGTWDWRGFGLPARRVAARLPRALAVGAWLLDDAGWTGPRDYLGLAAHTPPDACAEQGAGIGGAPALLVIGDGSARRSLKAPGHLDPRAEAYDAALATALGSADLAGLSGLDPELAEDLMVGGRAAFQVLAAAAAGVRWEPRLLRHEAPYGVGWIAAAWKAAETS